MGYRISYTAVRKVRGMEKRVVSVPALAAGFLLLFCILVATFWPRGEEMLKKIIFPGDSQVTISALEDLRGQILEGVSLKDALQTFCAQILEGAEIAWD